MLDHVPGLLTRTIAAIVSPRKTSSETSLSENVGDTFAVASRKQVKKSAAIRRAVSLFQHSRETQTRETLR